MPLRPADGAEDTAPDEHMTGHDRPRIAVPAPEAPDRSVVPAAGRTVEVLSTTILFAAVLLAAIAF